MLKELHDKIENAISKKLKHPLTCQEIHELAAAYADLEKNVWMERLSAPVNDEHFKHDCCCGCGILEEDDSEIRS